MRTISSNPDSVKLFGEYEALGAWMNYRHGALRGETKSGSVASERYRLSAEIT